MYIIKLIREGHRLDIEDVQPVHTPQLHENGNRATMGSGISGLANLTELVGATAIQRVRAQRGCGHLDQAIREGLVDMGYPESEVTGALQSA